MVVEVVMAVVRRQRENSQGKRPQNGFRISKKAKLFFVLNSLLVFGGLQSRPCQYSLGIATVGTSNCFVLKKIWVNDILGPQTLHHVLFCFLN